MIEVELKLHITPEQAKKIHQLSWLIEACQHPQHHHLLSAYYDTDELTLKKHGAALRVRQDEHVTVQTLKFSGHSDGGLSRRKEFEWGLQGKYLDYAVLEKELSTIYSEIHHKLKPIFSTEFVRTAWLLKDGDNVVELALDQGEVRCGYRSEEICELEIELKQGDEAFLFSIQQKLQASFDLHAVNISKAARGYELLSKTR